MSAPDLSRSVERPIAKDCARSQAIPFDDRFNFRAHSLSALSGPNPTTGDGSNPARSSGILVAHQQRAEIFALTALRAPPSPPYESFNDAISITNRYFTWPLIVRSQASLICWIGITSTSDVMPCSAQ
jgi:hypothetical protein